MRFLSRVLSNWFSGWPWIQTRVIRFFSVVHTSKFSPYKFSLTSFICSCGREKKWQVFPWQVSLLKSCHANLSIRIFVKEKRGIFLRPHEQIKLVKEKLSWWTLARVDNAFTSKGHMKIVWSKSADRHRWLLTKHLLVNSPGRILVLGPRRPPVTLISNCTLAVLEKLRVTSAILEKSKVW